MFKTSSTRKTQSSLFLSFLSSKLVLQAIHSHTTRHRCISNSLNVYLFRDFKSYLSKSNQFNNQDMKLQESTKLFKAIFVTKTTTKKLTNSALDSTLLLILVFYRCLNPLFLNEHVLILLSTLNCRISRFEF